MQITQVEPSSRVSIERRQSITDSSNVVVESVVNSEMFKILLKDMVEELVSKSQKQQLELQSKVNQPIVCVDDFIQQIGETLLLIARTEASKQIKEAEKFLSDMYQHKIKELQDKIQDLVEDKIKKIEQVMQKMEQMERTQQKNKTQTSLLSPIRAPLKSKQLGQVHDRVSQICKRAQLKQKIVGSTLHTQARSSTIQINNQSFLSDSFGTDATIERLTQKVKQIQETLKQQFKSVNLKIGAIKLQCKNEIDQADASLKEQLNSGFEGIWNVISNLQKRMMI